MKLMVLSFRHGVGTNLFSFNDLKIGTSSAMVLPSVLASGLKNGSWLWVCLMTFSPTFKARKRETGNLSKTWGWRNFTLRVAFSIKMMKSQHLHDGYDFILTFDSTRGWLSINEPDWKQVRLHVTPTTFRHHSRIRKLDHLQCVHQCMWKSGGMGNSPGIVPRGLPAPTGRNLEPIDMGVVCLWCACGISYYPFWNRGRPVAVPLLAMFLCFSGLQMIIISISSCAGGIFSVQSWWGWCLLLSASNPRQEMLSPPNLSIWEMHQCIDIPLTSGPSKMVTTEFV